VGLLIEIDRNIRAYVERLDSKIPTLDFGYSSVSPADCIIGPLRCFIDIRGAENFNEISLVEMTLLIGRDGLGSKLVVSHVDLLSIPGRY
jgi:hypothetical protein